MSKELSRFVCQECGAILPKWTGQCDICRAWNSVVEEVVSTKKPSKVSVSEDFFTHLGEECQGVSNRRKTNLNELNRVVGGGLVDGSVVLLGGAPGIGKSTLLLQILSDSPPSTTEPALAQSATSLMLEKVESFIYISAEESVNQILLRANRLRISNEKLKIASSSNIHQIISSISLLRCNGIVIIDSIQTISSDLIQSPPGSISQVRFCTQELFNFAKTNDIIVIIVGHITKDGAIAGPKTLEHMVDCVLYFEGESSYDYRILRCEKNRFGPTDEIGVFSMTEQGLVEVQNPSSVFLSERDDNVNGVAVFSGIEGTRPILLEVQALVSHTNLAIPKRASVGFDANRLAMIVAVLSKRCRLNLGNKDIYLNVAGGLRITEPGADLAVAAAIVSSALQRPLPVGSVFFGEVSLSDEIKPSHLAFSRVKEAQKLGFKEIFCSHKTDGFGKIDGIKITKIKSVRDLVDALK